MPAFHLTLSRLMSQNVQAHFKNLAASVYDHFGTLRTSGLKVIHHLNKPEAESLSLGVSKITIKLRPNIALSHSYRTH